MTEELDMIALFFSNPAVIASMSAGAFFLAGYLLSYYWQPSQIKVVKVRYVPRELARLARVLGVTEDEPTSVSYGRMIHDVIEERDAELARLARVNVELHRNLTNADKCISSLRKSSLAPALAEAEKKNRALWDERHRLESRVVELEHRLASIPFGPVAPRPQNIQEAQTFYVRNETPDQAKDRFRDVFGA